MPVRDDFLKNRRRRDVCFVITASTGDFQSAAGIGNDAGTEIIAASWYSGLPACCSTADDRGDFLKFIVTAHVVDGRKVSSPPPAINSPTMETMRFRSLVPTTASTSGIDESSSGSSWHNMVTMTLAASLRFLVRRMSWRDFFTDG